MKMKIGDTAPHFEVRDVGGALRTPTGDGRRTVFLNFFRHAGCPYCNLRVQELIKAAPKFDQLGVQVIAVFQSPEAHVRRDVGRQNAPFPIIPDPDRHLYKSYGVTASWLKFFRAFLLRPLRAPYAIFVQGFKPKFPEGDPHMAPAEFLISPEGTIQLAYYGKDISDHVRLFDVYAVAGKAAPVR